jgi:hypothetical protein
MHQLSYVLLRISNLFINVYVFTNIIPTRTYCLLLLVHIILRILKTCPAVAKDQSTRQFGGHHHVSSELVSYKAHTADHLI